MSCTVTAVHPGNPSRPAVRSRLLWRGVLHHGAKRPLLSRRSPAKLVLLWKFSCSSGLAELSRTRQPPFNLNGNDQADLQADRCRTCILLNSPLSCVSSAICHIQDMRTQLENWFQMPKICQPKIGPANPTCSKTLGFHMRDSDSDSTDLHVEGLAICAREGFQRSPLQMKINDVLLEVVHLVERLEADRQYAEEALEKERKKRKILDCKVDGISLWKLIEHPSIVQKEHEACSRDIAELKWQLKLQKQKVDQVQEKLLQAELLNRKLQEDIEFARNQIPIVKENMDRQKGILHQISIAQAEADDICANTECYFSQAQIILRSLESKYKEEKTSMNNKHLELTCQLSNELENLNHLKMLEKSLLAEIKDTEEAIILIENKCTCIIQQISKIVALEEIEEGKKQAWEAEFSLTEAQLQSKLEAFTALRKDNQEYEQKVEDYNMKICESEKAVRQMGEERKQMLQRITDNDEQWEKAKEEMTQVLALHSVIQAKLEEQEQLTFKEEETNRTQIDSLRKDLTNSLTVLEVVKVQSANVKNEVKKQQESSALTEQKLQKQFQELSSGTQALDIKIKGMKELIENFEKMQCEHSKILANLEKENQLKSDQLKASQDLHCATLQSIDSTIAKCTHFVNETEEYQKSSHEIEKHVETIPEVISELEKDFHVLEFKNKSAAHIMSTLQSDIHNWQQRTQQFKRTCTAHLKARKELMEDTKENLKASCIENKQLAINYEELKKILLKARQDSASALTMKNRAYKSYNYYTELSLLQKRMHKVLVKHLEQLTLRGLAELDWCQAVSQQTTQNIKTVEGKLSEEIQLISAFLQSFKDSLTTTKNAVKNKQTSPDATGGNE
ncbi:coiled-coil domain-containing protein 178 [Anableps anableps]